MFVKHPNINSYFTVIERRHLLQQVIRKNNKKQCLLFDFVCLLSNYCAALYTENLTLLEILVMILQGTASVDLLTTVTVFLQASISCCFVFCPLSSYKDKYQVSGERGKRRKTRQGTGALQDMQDGNLSVVQQCFSFQQKEKEVLIKYTHFNQAKSAPCGEESKLC